MVFSLWTCSRSHPCLLTLGRAALDGSCACEHRWSRAALPGLHHTGVPTEQKCSAPSAGYSCQFSSPSGLSHHVSITNLLYAKLEKSKACPHAVSTIAPHWLPCQSHTWESFGSERFDPEQRETSTEQSRHIKHMERNWGTQSVGLNTQVISEMSSHKDKQLINHHALMTTCKRRQTASKPKQAQKKSCVMNV